MYQEENEIENEIENDTDGACMHGYLGSLVSDTILCRMTVPSADC